VRKLLALIRAYGLTSLSYRLGTIVSVCGLVVSIVPAYFIAQALQPVMAKSIAHEGQQYFGFVVVGMIAFLLVATSLRALPEAIQSGIARGTLEALLATPTRLPVLLGGMAGYPVLSTMVQGAIALLTAWVLGAHVAWHRGLPALGILLLIILAHIPFGVVTASFVITFKTPGPLSLGVAMLSGFLGGVYYPTQVLPFWLHGVSAFLPLTYGLRALRRTLLDGAPFSAVASDVAVLAAFAVALVGASLLAFSRALRYARRAGTLAQY